MSKQAKEKSTETKPEGERLIGTMVPTRLQKFHDAVLPPDKRADLWRGLPRHIKPEVFDRNLLNALMQNVALLSQPPELVYREVAKAAALGLLLDPQLGEAYMILAWNGKANQYEPQLRVGYRGIIKLSRQAGNVANIYARETCAADKFTIKQGITEDIIHEPATSGTRGEPVLYYAVIKFKDGTYDFEWMSVADCRGVRERSDGWKAFKAGKVKSTPWATDEGEMSKKTVLRRLLKRQPQSPELQRALGLEDRAEYPAMHDITPLMSPIKDRLAGAIGEGEGFQHHVGDDVDAALSEARAVTVIDETPEPATPTDNEALVEAAAAAPPPDTPAAAAPIDSSPPEGDPAQTQSCAKSSESSTVGAQAGQGQPQPAPLNPKLAAARQAGREGRRKGIKERAVPAEYRERGRTAECAEWIGGWREEDVVMRGGEKK